MIKLVFLAWLTSVLLSQQATTTLGNLSNEGLIIAHHAFIKASESNINPEKFLILLNCESSLKKDAKGDYRKETGAYMAFGIAQWWKSSFDKYSRQYDLDLDYNSPYDQITLAALTIGDGGKDNWYQCSKKAKL